MEAIGSHEQNFSTQDKHNIIKFIKYDRHVPAKIKHKMWVADEEAAYFERAGLVAGAVLSGLTFFMPKVRRCTPALRVGLALLPGYLMFKWGQDAKEQILWQRAFIGYQKFVIHHGEHPKVFI